MEYAPNVTLCNVLGAKCSVGQYKFAICNEVKFGMAKCSVNTAWAEKFFAIIFGTNQHVVKPYVPSWWWLWLLAVVAELMPAVGETVTFILS